MTSKKLNKDPYTYQHTLGVRLNLKKDEDTILLQKIQDLSLKKKRSVSFFVKEALIDYLKKEEEKVT